MQEVEDRKRIHFIGIGGIGMSALASLVLERGDVIVSGSDLSKNYVTEGLESLGATVFIGHDGTRINESMTVVYTTGVDEANPEYLRALTLKCRLLHRSDFLKELSESFKMIAVSGTHGKTTTSALLYHVLKSAGIDPAYAVGGILPQYNSNGGNGSGDYFVVEACESDGTFLKYHPYAAIITNIDSDHIDYYGTKEALHGAFYQFIENVSSDEHLVWCGDDPTLKQHVTSGRSYGFDEGSDFHIINFFQDGWQITFDIVSDEKIYEKVQIPLIGRHSALNATAVFALSLSLGITEDKIRQAFMTFKGVRRRLECKGTFKDMIFLDDYAHHPVEIKTTLEGLKKAIGADRRLLAVYQPHRYSRTRDCMGLFKGAFDSADCVFVTNIFSAGEKPIATLTDSCVVSDIASSSSSQVKFVSRDEIVKHLCCLLQEGDVVVTLGAGDITAVGKELVYHFEGR